MDQSQGGHVEIFMNVTGASQAVALQKLQAHGGDLNAAINSFFNEGENSVPQMQSEETNTIDWMEEDEPLPRQPISSLVPPSYPFASLPTWATGLRASSGLGVGDRRAPRLPTAPIVSQPREVREVPIDWKDEEVPQVRSQAGPLIEEIPMEEASQLPSQSHSRFIVDDEDIPSTAPSRFGASDMAVGVPQFGSSTFPGDFSSGNPTWNSPLIHEVPAMANREGNDIEEEMLRAAIEASRKEAEAATRRMRPDFPEVLSSAGAGEARMDTEDADLARAVSLSLKTAEREKVLRDQGYLGNFEGGFRSKEDHHSSYGDGKTHDLFKRWGSTSTAGNSKIETGTPPNSVLAEDASFQQSISGTKDALSSPTEEVFEFDEQPLLRRRSGRRFASAISIPAVGSAISQQGLSTQQESSAAASMSANNFQPSAPMQRHDGVYNDDEWGGISAEEEEEAVMLEAAMFGALPENAALRFRYPSVHGIESDSDAHIIDDTGSRSYTRSMPQPLSPTVVAQRRLREQQDDEYLASLEADREKEIKAQIEEDTCHLKEAEAKAAAYAEEKLREEEELQKRHTEEELKRQSEAKKAALPEEPSVDDNSAVTLLVRMPDGSRQGRRFRKSETLQCLFDFIDASGGVLPGSYRLVRHYPRQAFTDAEHGCSFGDLGLTSKHEVLFLELI